MDHAPASSRRISRIASPFVLLLVFGLVLAGCRTSYTVRPPLTADPEAVPSPAGVIPPSPAPEPEETDPLPFLVAQADLEGAEATIQMRNGRAFPATVLTLHTEGLAVRPEGGDRRVLSLNSVRSVTVTDHGRGGLRGLGLGLAAGVGAGGLLGLIAQPFSSGFFHLSPAENAVIVGILVSAVTVPVGGLVGAAKGRANVYYFAPAPARTAPNHP